MKVFNMDKQGKQVRDALINQINLLIAENEKLKLRISNLSDLHANGRLGLSIKKPLELINTKANKTNNYSQIGFGTYQIIELMEEYAKQFIR